MINIVNERCAALFASSLNKPLTHYRGKTLSETALLTTAFSDRDDAYVQRAGPPLSSSVTLIVFDHTPFPKPPRRAQFSLPQTCVILCCSFNRALPFVTFTFLHGLRSILLIVPSSSYLLLIVGRSFWTCSRCSLLGASIATPCGSFRLQSLSSPSPMRNLQSPFFRCVLASSLSLHDHSCLVYC